MDKRLKPEGLPKKYERILTQFFQCYREATGGGDPILQQFSELLRLQLKQPFTFEPYHKKVRRPIDYYQFSLDFIRPLIDLVHSSVQGMEVLGRIDEQLNKGENVVLLANHQTETDPQAIAILLEKSHPHIGEKIIYVAGERVVADPLAIPFSMGCDLLCIYSKRYIDHPPELKAQKQLRNKNTMELMSRLLQEGGKIIYVAPSGGRDRRGSDGEISTSPHLIPPASRCVISWPAKPKPPPIFTHLLLPPTIFSPPPKRSKKSWAKCESPKDLRSTSPSLQNSIWKYFPVPAKMIKPSAAKPVRRRFGTK